MGTKRAKKPAKADPSWNGSAYVDAYELAKSGLDDAAIAFALKMPLRAFVARKLSDRHLREALDKARGGSLNSHHSTFRDYVYARLPPHLKEVWEKINTCEDSPSGYDRVKSLLDAQGTLIQQHLFMYALVDQSFSPSRAMRKLCLSLKTLKQWQTDPTFTELMDEIHFHKKNFFEAALIDRVAEGDVACTIFANKTINADRGYHETKTHKHSHDHNHAGAVAHVQVKFKDLELPEGTAEQVLEAMQKRLGVNPGQLPTPTEVKVIE